MKIYLDNCILNRPFDDQTQERIYLETQAFLILLRFIENETIQLITSVINYYENDQIEIVDRQEKIRTYIELAKYKIQMTDDIEARAIILNDLSFMGMDALHLACAEKAKVDYFVTCDDKLIQKAGRNINQLKLRVVSIFELVEVIYHVKDN